MNQSAVVALFRAVKAYIGSEAISPGTSVVFGNNERQRQINQGVGGANRVVLVPGRLPNGDDGEFDGAPGPGEFVADDGTITPRIIAAQKKIITFSIWADNSAPDSTAEDRQETLEQLYEYVVQAVQRSPAGMANAVWGACRYNNNPQEVRHGDEYLAELSIDTAIFDADPVLARPTAAAVNRG